MNNHQKVTIGSVWQVEHRRGNKVLTRRIEENLVPDEFINYTLDVILSGGDQVATWYMALFSNDHFPDPSDTYAAPGYMEATGYDETTRPQWQEGGVSSKSITNSANKTIFTMDGTNASIYGCSLVSLNTKGDTAGSGVLGPVAQFASGAITGIVTGDVLKILVTVQGCDVA